MSQRTKSLIECGRHLASSCTVSWERLIFCPSLQSGTEVMAEAPKIASRFGLNRRAVVFEGDCLTMMRSMPAESMQLIVTSPPYNLGKEYESRQELDQYVSEQKTVIEESARLLKVSGSICWQVGNYVDRGSIVPLDIILFPIFMSLGLKLRNRIVWHYEHGLHFNRRFVGRYETILWFTKTDEYYFNLDRVRVPQKYPGKKYFKGPRAGQYSCNPLGKNPGDLWSIPNVKSNHVEKTEHPCQFPVELVERLVLALSNEKDWVFDPFLGTGTSIVAAVRNKRKGAGAEILSKYAKIARERIRKALNGSLATRPMAKPLYHPSEAGLGLTTAPWLSKPEMNADSSAAKI